MSARWMTADEAEQYRIYEPLNEKGVADGMLIGRSAKQGRYIWYRGDGHIMIIAPPGAGKGQGFVVPNCLVYPGSMFVVDPKGENAAMTAEHRRKRGQKVYVIDPFGLSELPATSSFNPLSWLQTTEPKYFIEDCDALARALVADEAAEHKHFHDEAVNLMRALILYLFAHEPQNLNLNRLYDLAFGAQDYWEAIFDLMSESEVEHDVIRNRIRAAGNWYLGIDQKAQDMHRGTVQKNLQWLGGLSLPPVVEKSDFDAKSLKSEPCTIYLCIPGESRDLYKPYVRSLVTLILLGMYRVRGTGTLPVQFMLDEFYTTVGQLPIIDMAVGDMRGYGARFAFILQDLSQLKSLYDKTWMNFESSCGAVVYIGAENETGEHVSKRLGDEDYTQQAGGAFFNGSEVFTRKGQTGQRPLYTPQQIKLLGPRKEVVFMQHKPPLICDRISAWEDDKFNRLVGDNPMRNTALPHHAVSAPLLGTGKQVRSVDDYLTEKNLKKKSMAADATRHLTSDE